MQKNSVNKVLLVGHLGGDPEGRYTSSGRATTTFSLATNETWKKEGGEQENHTEWHHVVVWDRLADFAQEYLYKGQLISLEGRLHTRFWKDNEKNKHKVVEIICSNITPLEWRSPDKKV